MCGVKMSIFEIFNVCEHKIQAGMSICELGVTVLDYHCD